MGEVSVQVAEPRRRPVRRPGPSQIKMYGFCRLFHTTVVCLTVLWRISSLNVWLVEETWYLIGKAQFPCHLLSSCFFLRLPRKNDRSFFPCSSFRQSLISFISTADKHWSVLLVFKQCLHPLSFSLCTNVSRLGEVSPILAGVCWWYGYLWRLGGDFQSGSGDGELDSPRVSHCKSKRRSNKAERKNHFESEHFKVSRDTFHFPWKRKFSFFSLQSGSGWGQNTKNNGVLQGKFCIFTCPKDWHFSWKMNNRLSVQNVTFRLPGSLFF